jgi:hypothetical protein
MIMKLDRFLTAAVACQLLVGTTDAGSITCGDAIITDDQDVGQTTQQVLDQCGPPTSQDGDNWIYDRSNQVQGIYILHFDDSGELDSIEQQLDQG